MCCEGIFKERLHAQGLRVTPQRELILAVLHEINDYATAEEIYEMVHGRDDSVDLSTVYRTLELLSDLRLVAELDTGDRERRYELLSLHAPHHHLLCQACGKLIRVERHNVEPLLEHFHETYGFRANLDHLVIPGLCSECQKRMRLKDIPMSRVASCAN